MFDCAKLLSADLKLIQNEKKWKSKEADGAVRISMARHVKPWRPVMIKGMADFRGADSASMVATLEDLLHRKLVARHGEWNRRFLDGRVLWSTGDRRLEKVVLAYSASPLHPREVVYIKAFRRLERGFMLSYKALECPEPPKGRKRFTLLRGAHVVEAIDEQTVRLTILQQATLWGVLPPMLAWKHQHKVMKEEISLILDILNREKNARKKKIAGKK